MAKIRTFARLAAAAGLAAAALTGATSTATADNLICPAGNICVYKNANYSGGRFILPNTPYSYFRLSLHSYDTGGSVDNSISSVINNSDRRVDLRDNWYIPCNGPVYPVFAHSEVNDFSTRNTWPPEAIVNANDRFGCASIY
jgi:hypothetical protein